MSGKLKADLHLHTSEDRCDRIRHSSQALIDEAARQGFDVISITNHRDITYTPQLADYAKERDILLIPGCEAKVHKKHVLLYNFPQRCESFEQIRCAKDKNNLVIAPHPCFPSKVSLNGNLEKNLDIFDALEYCHFHHRWINFNKPVVELSIREGIPLVGTSDTHQLFQLGVTYSMIEAEKNMESIFQAIKKGKVEVFTGPLGFGQMLLIYFGILLPLADRKISDWPPRHSLPLPPSAKHQAK